MQILTLMDDGIHSAARFWILGTLISQLNPRMVVPSFRGHRGVLVQVVKIGITPQLATPSRRQEAETGALHHARQLHERR
jgi:hypothetical protein